MAKAKCHHHGHRWSKDDFDVIFKLRSEGLTSQEIGDVMGLRRDQISGAIRNYKSSFIVRERKDVLRDGGILTFAEIGKSFVPEISSQEARNLYISGINKIRKSSKTIRNLPDKITHSLFLSISE